MRNRERGFLMISLTCVGCEYEPSSHSVRSPPTEPCQYSAEECL